MIHARHPIEAPVPFQFQYGAIRCIRVIIDHDIFPLFQFQYGAIRCQA